VTQVADSSESSQAGPSPGQIGTFLLGSVGLLTVLLGALATANGGIGRTELNERSWLITGTACVLGALAAGGVALVAAGGLAGLKRRALQEAQAPAVPSPRVKWTALGGPQRLIGWLWRRIVPALLIVGVFALATGLGLSALAAVTHVSGRPAVATVLRWDNRLGIMLDGSVKVSDIPTAQHLEMTIWAIARGKASSIYEASFGPDSAGNVSHAFDVPLPRATTEVYIKAASGPVGRSFHCFSPDARLLDVTRSERSTLGTNIANNTGCLHLRIPIGVTK